MSSSPAALPPAHHRHLTLRIARGHLKVSSLRLLGYAILAVLLLKLVPSLKQAASSLNQVSVLWLLGAIALETASEMGFVLSWRAIVDPDNTLARGGGGPHMARHLAWAQLGGGTLVPAGTLSSIGVGGWLLHRLGMPMKRVAERQFSLSFLNTATDALALLCFGLALAIGVLPGERDLALTLLPASLAAFGIVAALLLARRSQVRAHAVPARHPKVAASLAAIAEAVNDTERIVFHGVRVRGLIGALAYLGFDLLVLWTAFLAVHASSVPDVGVVVMAYIIGALGGSLPLPAGIGAVGGIVGMLIVYGVEQNAAVAAVVIYQAVGLLVPLAGGGIAYLLLRRHLGPIELGATVDPLAGSACPPA